VGNHNLGYDVPEQRLQTRNSSDLRPKSVENWLANLPRANIGMMAKQVYALLTESNRLRMEPIERKQFLYQLYAPIDYLLEAMEKHYIGLSLPLPSKNQKISLLVKNLLHELVIAHKCAISDSIDSDKTRLNRTQLAMLMHNHLTFNNRLLKCFNLTYSTVPSTFWREQCQVFQYAEQLSISELAVFGSSSPWSILNRFKQSILLTLSTPSSLAQQEIQQLNSYLAEWVSKCRLLSMSRYIPSLHTQFIDLNSDKGPQQSENPDQYNNGWRIIDTSGIAPILKSEISQSQRHQPSSMRLPKETLQRVYKQFYNGQKRQFNRTTKSDSYTLAIGISAIHWMLSHHMNDGDKVIERPSCYKSTLISSVDFTDAPDIWDTYTNSSATYQLGQNSFNQPIKYQTYNFNVVNESANGFQLHLKEDKKTTGLKIGELVNLHKGFNGSGQQCGLAQIRWIHHFANEKLMIGIELLSPKAQPVEVNIHNENQEKEPPHIMRALLLPALPSIKQPATLITPDTYKVGQQVLLHQQETSKTIQLTRINKQYCGHIQFQFDYLQHKPVQTIKKEPEIHNTDDNNNLDNVWELL